DEADVLGALAIDDGGDDGVDADGLARAGGAGDEQVGHAGEVGNEGLAGDVFAEGDGDLGLGGDPVFGFEDFAHADGGGGAVGDLDADGGLAGDGGEDAHGLGAHAEGDVFVEAGDFLDAHAGGGGDFVAGDDGADVDLAGGDGDAEFAEDAHEVAHVAHVFLVGVVGGGGGLVLERVQLGEVVVSVGGREDAGIGLFGFLGFAGGDAGGGAGDGGGRGGAAADLGGEGGEGAGAGSGAGGGEGVV